MKNLRAFNDDVLISLRDLIGSYNFLNNKSVIQTTLVHDKSKGGLKDLQVIATSPASPKHNIDWFSLNFFRAYSSGIINSNLEEAYQYGLDRESGVFDPAKKTKKPILVMSRSLTFSELQNIEFFKHDYARKIILKNPHFEKILERNDTTFLKFMEDNSITFAESPITDMRTAISYMKRDLSCERVFIETGPTLYRHLYEEEPNSNPIDLLVLTIFDGQLPRQMHAGKFPSIDVITQNYKLLNMSKTYHSKEGAWTLFTFGRRQRKQQKTIEQHKGTEEDRSK